MKTSFDKPIYDEDYFWMALDRIYEHLVKTDSDKEVFETSKEHIMQGVKGLLERLGESERARFCNDERI